MAGRQDYEERKQAKIDRLNSSADKARAESTARHKVANNISKNIPFGQPILVGHHSEAGARRDADRIHNNIGKAIQASDKADYYSSKAVSVENNTAISSDDPQAIDKLGEKLENLLSKQARSKKVNAYYRKHKTCVGCDGLSDEVAQKLDNNMKTAYSWETAPYPSYELTSINAKIKAVKSRIESLQKIENMPDEAIEFDGGKIISNLDVNRIQIVFDERQSDDMVAILKRNGFNWAPSEKAWQRLRNLNALYVAKRIVGVQVKFEEE